MSTAAWYQDNKYEWKRLSTENGEVQLIRACREPTKIATRQALIWVAQELADETQDGEEIPYFDEFKDDLESINGKPKRHLEAGDPVRNRMVTFLAGNYSAKETCRILCPACLQETPQEFTICPNCHGMLVSYGERTRRKRESGQPRDGSADGDAQSKGNDVSMDQGEINELVRKVEAKAKKTQEDESKDDNQEKESSSTPMDTDDETSGVRGATTSFGKAEHGEFSHSPNYLTSMWWGEKGASYWRERDDNGVCATSRWYFSVDGSVSQGGPGDR